MFKNREEAGKLLGQKVAATLANLPNIESSQLIVVGLPRGGIPVAKEIASAVAAPLTIFVSKKIGAPFQPELAIGAVCSTGVSILNNELGHLIDDLHPYIQSEKARLTQVTKELENKWIKASGIEGPGIVKNKLAILVDDGIATGMTVFAAIRGLRALGAEYVIVASPVMSARTADQLAIRCNGLIYLVCPVEFQAVGQFYKDFHQVEDQEMINILKQYKNSSTAA